MLVMDLAKLCVATARGTKTLLWILLLLVWTLRVMRLWRGKTSAHRSHYVDGQYICKEIRSLESYYGRVAAGRKQADHTDWESYRLVGLDESLVASSCVHHDQGLGNRLVAAKARRKAVALHQDTCPSED